MKEFALGAVLSVIGEKLLCDFGDIQELLSYLTQQEVYTHQIFLVHKDCKEDLLKQFPQLKGYDDSSVGRENWEEFLNAQIVKYGATLMVAPIENFAQCDPIADAIKLFGKDKVIVVGTKDAN